MRQPPKRNREIELKLEAGDGADLAQLDSHPALARERASVQDLHAIYFDTPEHALRRAGLSLRIRQEDGRWVQTLKAAGSASGAALDRAEWETELDAPALDLGPFLETPLADLACAEDLRPVFETRIRRASRLLRREGALIEVAVDTGRIGSGNGAVEFGEVELELKDGPPGPLFALARSLAETERLHVSLVPKSERGYALAEGAAPEPVKAESAELSPEMPASEAFRAIARACLRHFLANERVERLRSDAEAVHQMRVAIRRMRAAMTLFKTVVRDDRTEAIKAGLKGIVGVLGEARDLDVFLATVLMPARRPERQDPELETMIADAQAKRDAAYESLHAMLRSPEFTGTILTVSEWVEAGPWQADGLSEERDGPVARLAAAELQRRWRAVRRRSKRLTRMEDEERHALRIAIKKLRYGIEFFGRLFPGKTMKRRRRKMLGAMEALQEILGELNDIAVAGREDAPPMPEALQRRQKRRAGKLLRAARDEAADMADLAPFWVERGKHRAGAITG